MSEPFLGEIRLMSFNFAPQGWAQCNGQFLAINQNQALFSLLGTTYGGNGQTTFALPDLRGRVPIHVGGSSSGQGPGLSVYSMGQQGGVESVTLSGAEMPAHTDSQPATAADQTTNQPNRAVPAHEGFYAATPDGSQLAATSPSGASQPHENRQHYLGINYIIALQEIFPARN